MKIHLDNNEHEPWWVIALKVIIYAAGLLLAGVGTANAAIAML